MLYIGSLHINLELLAFQDNLINFVLSNRTLDEYQLLDKDGISLDL